MLEPLLELILAIVGSVLEAVLEALLELLAEAVLDLATRALARVFETVEIRNPVLGSIGYVVLGVVTGGLSLYLFPHPLVHPSRIHGISLLVSPVLTGSVMSLIGSTLRRQDKRAVQIESFGYGFAFAFGMAIVRFLFAH